MSAALDLVKSLGAAGVEFSTDGERIRWRGGDGKMTPEIVAIIAAEKLTVIDFLSGKVRTAEPIMEPRAPEICRSRDLGREWKADAVMRPDDAETYADALRIHGPMTYGMAMRVLGWGGTRAGQAEDALKAAGRIALNDNGRAKLVR